MRSVNPALVLAAIAVAGCNALVACSASGEFPELTAPVPDEGKGEPAPSAEPMPTDEMDASVAAPPMDATVDATTDAKDAAKDAKDSGKDAKTPDAADAQVIEAGAEAAAPGTACAVKDAVQKQSCGACGFQLRLCDTNDGDDGGATLWQPWGFCQAEVPQGCMPGTNADEACGNCGTRNKVCQNDCTYAVGTCKNQPLNSCSPGTTQFQVGLSCVEGGRMSTCSAACAWGNLSDCYVPDPNIIGPALIIGETAGNIVTGNFNLDANVTTGRLGSWDTCPNATIGTIQTAYQYVQLVNKTAKVATVSVWSSKATGENAPELATVMAAYTGTAPPATPAERAACTTGVSSYCYDRVDPTSCLSSWAGLMKADSKSVTIKPYSSLFVYVAGYSASTTVLPQAGPYILSARTDSIR